MKNTKLSYSLIFGKLPFLLTFLILATYFHSHGQVFQRYTEENGLPINLVSDITQDKFGFIWVATEAGLVRLDGSRAKVYQLDSKDSLSISNNEPVRLAEADNGDLWIASNEGQLDRYLIDFDQFERHQFANIADLPNNRVYALEIDSNVIWLAIETGLVKYDPIKRLAQKFSLNDLTGLTTDQSNTIFDIVPDASNTDWLWLFCHAGLFQLDKRTMQAEYIEQDVEKAHNFLVLRSGLSEKHLVWAGSGKYGLKAYNVTTNQWQYFVDHELEDPAGFNDISAMARKSENEFWVTSWSRGFGIFNISNQTYRFFDQDPQNPYNVQSGEHSVLFIDADENVWIGGNEGVSFFNPSMQYFHSIDLPKRTITHDKTDNFPSTAVTLNDTLVLIGSVSGNGLYLGNTNSGQSELITNFEQADYFSMEKSARIKKLSSLDVYDLCPVSIHKIWVAMHHQLAYYDVVKKALIFPTSTNIDFFKNAWIRELKVGQDGFLWGLNRTENTLFKCNKSTGDLIQTVDIDTLFETALQDSKSYGIRNYSFHPDGTIWIIGFQDVIIYNPANEAFRILPRKQDGQPGITGKGFYNIDFDADGNAYIASILNGLQVIRLHETDIHKRYQLLTTADGLPVNKVIRVKCLQDDVWMTTRKGLVRYRPAPDEWRIFDRSDGIPNIDLLNYWQPSLNVSADGRIYFGNPNQVIWFHNDSIYENKRPPIILISELETHAGDSEAFGHLQANPSIHLDADQNFFSVKFGMDDYTQAHRQVFRYRLVGYDDHWVSSGKRRMANYTRVPGGKYLLEIEGANSTGTWSKHPAQISIHIAIPFFKSNIFYALIALFTMGLLYLAYQYRVIQIREKDQIRSDFQVKVAEAEIQALRAQMNPHFIFNSLNSINTFIITNDIRAASRYLTKFSKLMRLILNNSRKETIPLQDELDALNIYIEMEQVRSSHSFTYDCQLHLQSNPSSIMIPSMLVQPFVENAIWHGLMPLKKNGRITFTVTEQADYLYYVIEDNGIGRKRAAEIKASQEVKRASKGLQITRERIRMNDVKNQSESELKIEDKMDENGNPAGTKVTIKLNIQRSSTANQIEI